MVPPSSPSMGVTSSSLRFSVSSTASSSASTTPTHTPKQLPDPLSPPSPFPARPRGQSTSVIRPPVSSSLATPLSRVTSEPNVALPHSDSLEEEHEQNAFSVFGISLGTRKRMDSAEGASLLGTTTPPNAPPLSWWGGSGRDSEMAHRPWRDPRRKKTVPEEQTEGYVHTRQRVAQAAASILGTAGDVAHEVLFTTVDLLEFAPVPGLASAARVLLNIWDALEMVDTNRLACLRLTERCADILISVREEIHETGDSVGEELATPIAKLEESFLKVQRFLQKQAHRPFLKRYLKRDEILAQIRECDASLGEALGRFSISIQIRILKQVQASERRREADTRMLIETFRERSPTASLVPNQMQETPTLQPTPKLEPPGSPPALRASQILPALRNLHSTQDTLDAASDSADLRALMRAALQTSSDVEMLEVLQCGREEMPEAIKTLQRALERVGEKEEPAEVVEVVVEKGKGKAQDVLQRMKLVRSKTIGSTMSSTTGSGSGGSGTSRCDSDDGWGRDTLDREFIESGIDALRRMSRGVETNLPSWTITRYEVDREQKIGIGFFSDVYRGMWRGRTVAIKVLAPTTPRELFVREIGIWKGLRHENVLELYGASSASGERPWFFVSAYMRRGSLVEFLKRVAVGGEEGLRSSVKSSARGSPRGRSTALPMHVRGKSRSPGGNSKGRDVQTVSREGDLFRFMLEIAKGMDYLHRNGVLHGDLKAANVLVDDDIHCVISDFGQSEMKSEAYRISGTTPPHGTLRWQAPELMSGLTQHALTPQMDVYAYAILCVEILSMGRLPWALMDDEAVRHFVLKQNERPAVPNTSFNTPLLQDLLRVCWHRDPSVRPSFAKIVVDVKVMRKAFLRDGGNGDEVQVSSPIVIERDKQWDWNWDHPPSKASPDMRPVSLPPSDTPPKSGTPPGPGAAGPLRGVSPNSAATNSTFLTAEEEDLSNSSVTVRPAVQVPPSISPLDPGPRHEETVANAEIRMPEPVIFTATAPSTRASSLFASTPSSRSLEDLGLLRLPDPGGYESPAPQDQRIALLRDERRFRLLLGHQFHPSLTLPLWSPSPVALGAVGYLSKPAGSFVTLFGAFHPERSLEEATRELPSLYGYGRVTTGGQRQDKRNAAQRGLDAVVGLLTSRGRGGPVSQSVSRRYSFPLRAGHKTAHMCTETTMYRYVESLEVPKKWFKANVDTILHIYGPTHDVQKEDLFLVIGTLDTPDYALFVSHHHPDGQAHFNVFSSPRTGQPWGTFTTDTEVPPELGGPSYDEPLPDNPLSTCKVSNNGGPWDTILIARLRFKPDALEPTSL